LEGYLDDIASKGVSFLTTLRGDCHRDKTSKSLMKNGLLESMAYIDYESAIGKVSYVLRASKYANIIYMAVDANVIEAYIYICTAFMWQQLSCVGCEL
jgi:hypothetical protein